MFLVTATFGFIQPFLNLYLQAAGFSKTQIGLTTGLAAAIALLAQPLLGKLTDHFDARRPAIALSALLAGIAYFLIPWANSFPTFLALVAIGANGTMYLNAAGAVLVGRMVTGKGGGTLYANLRLWGTVGYILVTLISGLATSFGTRVAQTRSQLDPIFHFGPFLFLAIAVLAWFLPDRRNHAHAVKGVTGKMPPNLVRFLASYFLWAFALYGATGYLSLYIRGLGGTPIFISGAFVAGAVVEVGMMRVMGAWSDRYGRRPALAITFLLLPIRLMLYSLVVAPWQVIGVQALHGINFGIMGVVSIAFANDLAAEGAQGRAQAQFAATMGLASAIAPLCFGLISDAIGLRTMWLVAAGVAALGAVGFLLTVEDSHRESHSLAENGPRWLQPVLRILDAPPGR
jgi:PPP family 3-phenylpropionic acid transporter